MSALVDVLNQAATDRRGFLRNAAVGAVASGLLAGCTDSKPNAAVPASAGAAKSAAMVTA